MAVAGRVAFQAAFVFCVVLIGIESVLLFDLHRVAGLERLKRGELLGLLPALVLHLVTHLAFFGADVGIARRLAPSRQHRRGHSGYKLITRQGGRTGNRLPEQQTNTQECNRHQDRTSCFHDRSLTTSEKPSITNIRKSPAHVDRDVRLKQTGERRSDSRIICCLPPEHNRGRKTGTGKV